MERVLTHQLEARTGTLDMSVAAFTTNGAVKFQGDYAGLAASRLAVHAVWGQAQNFENQVDNPTGTHQRAFAARIRLASELRRRR